jgi:hypothetical protein
VQEMDKIEFKDRLIEILSESDDLHIQNIAVSDDGDTIEVYLDDGGCFVICADNMYATMLGRSK